MNSNALLRAMRNACSNKNLEPDNTSCLLSLLSVTCVGRIFLSIIRQKLQNGFPQHGR